MRIEKLNSKGRHNMQRSRKLVGPILIAIVAIMSLGLIGCSQLSTNVDIEEEQTEARLLTRKMVSGLPSGDSLYAGVIMSAEEGGRMALCDVELYFPPNSLNSDTLVSITIPNIMVFENHFGTDGLVFNVPVRIVMSYRDADLTGVDESSISMAWYDERTDSWDHIDCWLDTVNKTVTANVSHFSAYALISD
jgi:hypothetical protein